MSSSKALLRAQRVEAVGGVFELLAMGGEGKSSVTRVSSILVALFLLLQQGLVIAQNSSAWLTLTGNAPAVIANGGFSGLFPDSSTYAYSFALIASSNDTILWCDVRLTKDGVGICLPNIILDNCTDISNVYPNAQNVYLVNGVPTTGWFSVDYNMTELLQVHLMRSILSRNDKFDGSMSILAVEDVINVTRAIQTIPPFLWLNIQHNIFYGQHNLNMTAYVLSVSMRVTLNYLSSPELAFLSDIAGGFNNSKTKLIFRFLDKDIAEPSTNQTYGSLLNNLTFIKTFASGILVPRDYIWPVDDDNYLLPYTSIVMDAHKAGLEIYAAGFANEKLSYNYSYDPLAEVLSFVDNGVFSVDGVLTDFPITPSEAIGCFSHTNKSIIDHGKPLIISHNGASGDYPDCTDLAYQKAVDVGADFIDCPVQVTQDGIAICMGSIDLIVDTTVTTSPFKSHFTVIPEIQSNGGIFTFNFTWNQIQTNLKPKISNPEFNRYRLQRNPRYMNAGNFMRLSDFLAFAKDKPLAGVLISVEYAAFMAEKLGFSVVDAVISALEEAGYNNQTALEVMILSTNSSVLVKFKQQTKYKIVYKIDESIRDAVASSIADIREFADVVAINRQSVYPETNAFIVKQTDIVSKLQTAGLAVYVYLFQNEFVAQPWDFYSDATVEINAYVVGVKVDGIITDFPATAVAYKRNSCRKMGNDTPSYMLPVEVGGLLSLIDPQVLPPALAPMPILNVSDVVEPPLPPVAATGNTAPPPSLPSAPSSAMRCFASLFISLAMICGSLLLVSFNYATPN